MVGEVVGAMQVINQSSQKIADIIAVIDGIAFQANILAQRSDEAAKEIKSLIASSVDQVEQGSMLVAQAGQTMAKIVNAITCVNDIVAETSEARTEQSNGVSQVGQAVTQIDHATQQNAALVEQSAAAAEGLKDQAHRLVQSVAVFKLAR